MGKLYVFGFDTVWYYPLNPPPPIRLCYRPPLLPPPLHHSPVERLLQDTHLSLCFTLLDSLVNCLPLLKIKIKIGSRRASIEKNNVKLG